MLALSLIVAIVASVPGTSEARPPPHSYLVEYSFRPDGSGGTQIARGPELGRQQLSALSRSADGTLFAYPSSSGLLVGSFSSGTPSRIDATVLGPDELQPFEQRFSRDGTSIAFTAGECFSESTCAPGRCETNCVEPQVYVSRSDGTGVRKVAAHGYGPSWSADGRLLAFEGHKGNFSDGRDLGLFVARTDGAGARRLSPGEWPLFAPRGNLIAYLYRGLRVMRADGSHRRTLLSFGVGTSVQGVLWSPRANAIAISLAQAGNPSRDRLLAVSLATGRAPTLSRHKEAVPAAWSSSGTRLAYVGHGGLYTVAAEGGHSTLVRRGVGNPAFAKLYRWPKPKTITVVGIQTFFPSPD
jgi:hypothetical protein